MAKAATIGLLVVLVAPAALSQDACVVCSCDGSVVDCGGLQLVTIPPNIPDGTTTLRLGNNRLASISGQPFNNLANLVSLDLSNNPLGNFQSGLLAGLASLEDLFLGGTGLESIDDTAFHSVASTLKVLHLNDNDNLRSISAQVFNGFPVSTNPVLEQLILRNTGLGSMAPHTFGALGNLWKLDLSENQLTSDHLVQALSGLSRLRELRLSRNRIAYFNSQLLQGASALTDLYIDQNPLEGYNVHPNSFSGTQSLATLDLNTVDIGNLGLNTLNETIFEGLVLSSIKVAGSNWDCCDLGWLTSHGSVVADLPSVICDRPQNARGGSLASAIASASNLDACGQDEPDVPAIENVTGTSETWATLTWSPVHGNAYAVDYYGIVYAKTTEGTCASDLTTCTWLTGMCATGVQPANFQLYPAAVTDCKIQPGDVDSTGLHTFNVTGLHPYSTYAFRVRAHNQLGWDTWAGDASVTATTNTTDSIPGPPAGLEVDVTVSPESLVLTWDIPERANGLIVKYDIRCFNASGYDRPFSTNGTTRTLTITGLSANMIYSLAVTASTRSGPGAESDIKNARTAEKAPAALNERPVASDRQSTAVTVDWSILPLGGQHGTIESSVLKLQLGNEPSSAWTIVHNGGPTDTSATIVDLTPATRYTFYAHFTNSAGAGEPSPGLSVTTLNAEPGAPDLPSGYANDNVSITITWNEPIVTNGEIEQYDVQVRLQGSGNSSLMETSQDGTTVVDNPVFTYTKRNLQSSTTYEFRVRANTRVAEVQDGQTVSVLAPGAWSDWGENTTLEGIASAVKVNAVPIQGSATSNRIRFQYPDPSNGVIKRFTVYQINASQYIPLFKPVATMDEVAQVVYETTNTSDATSGDVFVFDHTGLDPYTNYTYTVTASTSVGTSAYGEETATALTNTGVPHIQPAPSLLVIGHSQIEVSWEAPEFPNGVITAFEVRQDGQIVYTGVPIMNARNRFAHNITNLEDGKQFEFTVTSVSDGGRSDVSSVATEATTSASPDVSTTVIITLICILIVVLTVGLIRERTFNSMVLKRASMESIHGNFFQRDGEGRLAGEFGRDDDESSDSGSEYAREEVKRPSLERVAQLRKSIDFATDKASESSDDEDDGSGAPPSPAKLPPVKPATRPAPKIDPLAPTRAESTIAQYAADVDPDGGLREEREGVLPIIKVVSMTPPLEEAAEV
jgi:hypothetical protein